MWPLIRILPREFHFNFVRLAPYAAIFSAILIALSGVSFFTKGLNLGIDFIGGSMIEVQTVGPADIGALRQTMMRVGGEDAQVQQLGAPNGAMLRFRTAEGVDPVEGAEAIKTELTKSFPGITFKKVEVVGPKVSGELMTGGFMALGVAVFLMLLYIWFRFQLQFGLGAVVGVFHDVLLTLGMLSLTHLEFSMTSIAALLTVIGYSMNEKVITFDRLRENLRKYKTAPLADIINKSENERLSRTLITGTTAILALSGAVFFGGPVLLPLVVTMVFGVVVGTYSSIYVALPIILLWGVKRGDEPAEPLKPMTAR
ncbi:preprotein translocase subunit SecF [Phenylobacterium haematophilum]|uniref:Protein-export membrane protein SecF n=1 Tax=Phenylobacterium haematophilum TaxID=98513 RepID=A0A839ZWL7_9CAUL|nr:protein translocase subunit SecF [Phenylobacterium haematophilum]MBB3889602.1 preprotein translocase subunit SecF [Phenylobacterium haematophilum]